MEVGNIGINDYFFSAEYHNLWFRNNETMHIDKSPKVKSEQGKERMQLKFTMRVEFLY